MRARVKPLLFTCMPESEGGRFPDRDRERRRRLLSEAVRLGFDLVDVNARDAFPDVVASKAGRGLVLSWHDLEGTPDDLDAVYDRMAALGPDIVKIAVTARSISDLGRLLAFAARHAADAAPRLIALAMGPLGVASRILGGRFGAPFTFASAAAGLEAAPGQIPARTLVDGYRVRQIGPDTRVFGLVGSDVLRSLSPAIQNRAFAERGVDAVYVPLQAESLPGLVDAIPALGVSGFSVTRPYKREIVRYLDSVTPHAAEAGSANTVLVQDGRLVGLSTDGDGVLLPLRRRIDPSGRAVTILGAGGAARAAAFALVRAGARVTVVARRAEQARRGRGRDRLRRRRARGRSGACPTTCSSTPRRSAPVPSRASRPWPRACCGRAASSSTWSTSRARRRSSRPRGLWAASRSTASRCWWRRRWGSSRPGRACRRRSRRWPRRRAPRSPGRAIAEPAGAAS